nr:glycoside hydrolase family 92 protein [Bacteroidaceae bacterium]
QADGLSGNEDVGQMSAWYILSSLGLYQVDPAGGEFILGFPLVDGAVINIPTGKTFEIEVHKHLINKKNKACYVSAISLNGQAIHQPSISYQDIMQGGKLVFEMTDQPASWMNIDK